MAEYRLPIRLVSEMNMRDHWGRRNRRAKGHKKAALIIGKHALPCTVTITRVGPRMMDDDNLVMSAKFLRDGIAARLGVDDADPRVTWRYAQQIGEYAAIVMIEPKTQRPQPEVKPYSNPTKQH